MSEAVYASVARQISLQDELKTIAANIANADTSGFRTERLVFSEYLKETGGPLKSLSMATARARYADVTQGELVPTGGVFDFAIEGEGYFLIQTPGGERLTRNGTFSTTAENTLATADGHTLLGEGGAAVFIPQEAEIISVAGDGVISADGEPIGRIELVTANPETLTREAGMLYAPADGFIPVENARIAQGFLEASNVNAIEELARMIEVQRAYEAGQTMLQTEDERIQLAVQKMGEVI